MQMLCILYLFLTLYTWHSLNLLTRMSVAPLNIVIHIDEFIGSYVMQFFIVIVCCTFIVIVADKLLLTALLDQDFTHARWHLFLIRC